MCPGKVSPGEETDRLHVAGIRRIENRYSVAEHVADVKVPAVEHDLNTVRPSSDIAIGKVAEALPDALRRNDSVLRVRLPGTIRHCRETNQAFPAVAPSDLPHVPTLVSRLSIHRQLGSALLW